MQTIREIERMMMDGITLESGTTLTPKEVQEMSQLFKIYDGINSYLYVKESIEDVNENGEERKWLDSEEYDTDFFEDIRYEMMDRITGDDEYYAVLSALGKRGKK